jgi:capsular polysaccharide biosynthesis protein
VYKIAVVIILLLLCVTLGALIALFALLPSYFLFIQIVIRVTLNWTNKQRIE